ncbi:MAG: ABC transporter substrate-binding protein [Kofleriaceae bacterium]
MRLALLLVFAACNPPDHGPRFRAAGATEPQVGGELRIALTTGVTSLDPAIAYDEPSSTVVHPLYDTLIDYDAGTQLVPRLAARLEVSRDGLGYRFWLRDARYSDGRPIVAADFVTSLERVLAMPTSPFRPFLADVDGADSMIDNTATHCRGLVAHGEHELEIRLARPNAAFLNVLAMSFAAPLTAAHLAAAGDDLRRAPLASGPYELVAWDEGQHVTLRRNPHYHDPARQRIERLVVLENVARDTQFLMFERGELATVERLSLTAPDYTWLANEPSWAPYVHRSAGFNAFGSRMNVRMKPFDDRRVRQAMNYAQDKRSTIKLLGGGAVTGHGMLPPGTFGRDDTLAPYPYDPARARALLTEAGYPHGFAVDYLTTSDEEAQRLAQSLQSDLARIGVRIAIQVVSNATYQTATGKRDGVAFGYQGWTGDYPDPTSFLDPKFHSRARGQDNATNDTEYANAEVDDLLDAARAEPDRDRRAAMYRRIERVLYEDAPWIFDYHRMTVEIAQPYVRDYQPHPIWLRDFTAAWLDLGSDGAPVSR